MELVEEIIANASTLKSLEDIKKIASIYNRSFCCYFSSTWGHKV